MPSKQILIRPIFGVHFIALSAGLHPLELRYFDYNGGEIRLVLLGDDGARHPLDTDLLRHDP